MHNKINQNIYDCIVSLWNIFFEFQKLYYVKEAHSIFVTGLAFMPSSEAAQAITGSQDFTLLSISADNTIRLHQVAPRGQWNSLKTLYWIQVDSFEFMLSQNRCSSSVFIQFYSRLYGTCTYKDVDFKIKKKTYKFFIFFLYLSVCINLPLKYLVFFL